MFFKKRGIRFKRKYGGNGLKTIEKTCFSVWEVYIALSQTLPKREKC